MSEEFQTWKQHFINQAKGLIPHQRKFYKVSMQQGGGGQPTIKMVSPTEQIVERAKASLDHPPSVYDPVTGVMQQTKGKHVKIATHHKRKRKINNKKQSKKKRLSKLKSKKPKKKTNTKRPKKKVTSKRWW